MSDHPCRIFQYMHCRKCLEELPAGVSPQTWSKNECGWTPQGFQVWCKRHNCNVVDLDFQGQKVTPYRARN